MAATRAELVDLVRNILMGWAMERDVAALVLEDFAPPGVDKEALLEELYPADQEISTQEHAAAPQ